MEDRTDPELLNIFLHMHNILWLLPTKRAARDERVGHRYGEPTASLQSQKHERELSMFLRLHHEIPGMRVSWKMDSRSSENS